MYQSYPGAQLPEVQEVPETERRPAPPAVQTATRLMYVAMAVNVIAVVIAATLGVSKSAVKKAYPALTPSHVNTAVAEIMAIVIISGLASISCWFVIAWASKRGKNWGRITGTALFAVDTFRLLLGATGGSSSMIKVFDHVVILVICEIIIWLLALAAVVFLWKDTSTTFFKGTSPAPEPLIP
jgi:hypothetical protein